MKVNCTECGAHDARNIVSLDIVAPVPGTGWGCVVCGLPQDGAVAVLCDECFGNGLDKVKYVCKGFLGDGERIALLNYEHKPFGHDEAKHGALEAQS
jgi:hypothetical protein